MSDDLLQPQANAVLGLPQDLEYNELQSQMQLKVQGKKLTGRYNTKVGDAQGWYDLVGLIDARDKTSQAVAFVVSWQNAHKTTGAATAWSAVNLEHVLGQIEPNRGNLLHRTIPYSCGL
jgi:Avidin family